jgi:hypothetical protein
VEITGEYVAELRSCLTGEGDYIRLMESLQARDGVERSALAFFALTWMSLQCAARRRFPDGYTDADVVRLVGQARAKLGGEGYEIDPLAAEAALRAALGNTAATAHTEEPKVGIALFPVLFELLEQDGITADRMDDFLADVLPLAEAWLARQEPTPSSDLS